MSEMGAARPLSLVGEGAITCLVVMPREGEVPLDLVESIRRRNVDVRIAHETDRALETLEETGAGVMVVAEPQQLHGVEVMVMSARLRYPGLRIWRYAHGEAEPLRPYQPGDAGDGTGRGESAPDGWRDDVPVSAEEMTTLLGDLGVESPATPTKLGDAVLVEKMLGEGGRDVLETAVRIIRQRTGIEGVRFERGQTSTAHGGVLVAYRGRTFGRLSGGDGGSLGPSADWLARWLELERSQVELLELANRDDLTGLWNRRYFDRALEMILAEAEKHHLRVTLMIYDVDDFKSYNDLHGHSAGDEILIETGKLMSSVVRKQDVVARIGGDEFAVIFWDAEPQRKPESEHPRTVRAVAERFQKAVREHKYPKLGRDAPGVLTISGGLAGYPLDGQTPAQLVEHADRMLIKSKSMGKNVLTFGAGTKGPIG